MSVLFVMIAGPEDAESAKLAFGEAADALLVSLGQPGCAVRSFDGRHPLSGEQRGAAETMFGADAVRRVLR